MKNNIYKIAIGLGIILIICAVWYYINFQKYAPSIYVKATDSGEVTINTLNNTISTSTPTYTMSDVATHKDATSCYSVVNNSVYDLTTWINMHPGGKGAILGMCGVDGTADYTNEHGTKSKILSVLARFKIGNLAQ